MEYEKKFVEMLIERFNIEFKKQDRSGVYGLTQRRIAYNSNKIEGSTLTEQHTSSLFDTGSIMANGEVIRAKDIEEANGHFVMFNHMLDTLHQPLSQNLIKEFHYKLKNGVFEDLINGYLVGEYKNRRNFVSDIRTALPEEVEDKMDKLLKEYDVDKQHSLEEISIFHAEFEAIHPFQDGNGRTGRLVAFRECLKNEIIPLIIEDKNKVEYYFALNDYQNYKKTEKLFQYFKKEQNQYFDLTKDVVVPYSNKSIELRIAEAKTSKELSKIMKNKWTYNSWTYKKTT